MLLLTSLWWGTHLPFAGSLALQVLKELFFSHPAWRLGLHLVSTHYTTCSLKKISEKPNLQTSVHGNFKSWLIITLQLICPLILYHWHEDFWDCMIYEPHHHFLGTKPKGQERARVYVSHLGQESVRFQIHSHISTFQDVNAFNLLNLGVFFLPILDQSLKSLLQLWTMSP